MVRGPPHPRALIAGAAVAVLGGGAFLLWRLATMRNDAARLAERIRAEWPDSATPWADDIAAAVVATVPLGFPGGVDAWFSVAAGILDRESRFSEGAGYSPRGAWFGAGDSGNAETPWQLDRRYHAKHLARADRTPELDSRYALGDVLAPGWRRFRNVAAMLAAYNASASRVAAVVDAVRAQGREPTAADVDPLTFGRNYASDVQRRAEAYA